MKTGNVNDAMVRLQVVLGERCLSVRDLGTVGEGSIVKQDAIAGEPVALLAEGQTVAWGEVVVLDENFGIRVTKLDRGSL